MDVAVLSELFHVKRITTNFSEGSSSHSHRKREISPFTARLWSREGTPGLSRNKKPELFPQGNTADTNSQTQVEYKLHNGDPFAGLGLVQGLKPVFKWFCSMALVGLGLDDVGV